MDTKKVADLYQNIGRLIAKQNEARDTMRQIVLAVAREHLMQNNVRITHHDWEVTEAALMYGLGYEKHFKPRCDYGFIPAYLWPTHLMIFNLKPVRIVESEAQGFFHVKEPKGKTLETLDAGEVAERYVRLKLVE